MFLAQVDPSIFSNLIEQYGVMGLMFVVILSLYLKQSKRLQEVEKKNDDQAAKQLEAYEGLIKEYISLLEKNTGVIGKLTGCVNSIKDAIERIDRRTDGK
jgi:hypothetical protein